MYLLLLYYCIVNINNIIYQSSTQHNIRLTYMYCTVYVNDLRVNLKIEIVYYKVLVWELSYIYCTYCS